MPANEFQLTDKANKPSMTKLHSVTLRTIKTPGETRLDYVETPLDRAQKRFASRNVLQPDLDLNAFTCSAAVDWIDVGLLVQRPTQFQ